MTTVHYLNNSLSQRVLRLLAELGFEYARPACQKALVRGGKYELLR